MDHRGQAPTDLGSALLHSSITAQTRANVVAPVLSHVNVMGNLTVNVQSNNKDMKVSGQPARKRSNEALLSSAATASQQPLHKKQRLEPVSEPQQGWTQPVIVCKNPLKAVAINKPPKAVAINKPPKAVAINKPPKAVAINKPKKAVAKNKPKKALAKNKPKKALAKNKPKKAVARNKPKKAVARNKPKKAVVKNKPRKC